jgi:hypothetical protein
MDLIKKYFLKWKSGGPCVVLFLMNMGDGVGFLSTGTDRLNCNAPMITSKMDDADAINMTQLILYWKCGEPGALLETGRPAAFLSTETDRKNGNVPIHPCTIHEPDACTFRIM